MGTGDEGGREGVGDGEARAMESGRRIQVALGSKLWQERGG